jgi:uncharacterized RDD family membrane protein YckC
MINSYYLLINGEKIGPHTQYEVMDMDLDVHTMVLSPLASDWGQMLDLPEFNIYLENKGIYMPTRSSLASFWWRLLAYFIDYIIIIIIAVVIATIYYTVIAFLTHDVQAAEQSESALNLLGIVVMILYHAVFEATNLRGSIGKMVCKLSVVDVNGKRLGFGKALARNAGKLLSGLILGLGFLNILWDNRRQGWHDELAKTYVIRRRY